MKQAGQSIWTNKWTEVYDFTPNKKADDGSPNFTISSSLKLGFVTPFEELQKRFEKIKEEKGLETNDLREIEEVEEDGDLLNDLVYESDAKQEKLDLGDYFSDKSLNMLRNVPVTRPNSTQPSHRSFLLLAFVQESDVFDSITAQ